MPHDLSLYDFELPTIESFLAGDSRVLAFQVTDDQGNGVDISNATVEWALFDRAYQSDAAQAVIDDGDSDVELVIDSRVDTGVGEWEVRLSPVATDEIWGGYYHRPRVIQQDGTEASWFGEIVLTA